MREDIVDDHCITPKLGRPDCIDKHVANVVQDGEVESLNHSFD